MVHCIGGCVVAGLTLLVGLMILVGGLPAPKCEADDPSKRFEIMIGVFVILVGLAALCRSLGYLPY